MDNTFKPTCISTCTGMRGLEIGVERVIGPLQVAAYVEIEAFIIWNLMHLMEQGLLDPAPIWANLKTFPMRDFYHKIHFYLGGYPCQPFSVAGNRKGKDDPRHLWPYMVRDIETIQPFCCFFENVEGHLTLGFEEVSRDLRKMGYQVEAGLYTATEAGAPHQRKRLFILAILGNAPQSFKQWLRNQSRQSQGEIRGSGAQFLANSNCIGHTRRQHQSKPGEHEKRTVYSNQGGDWVGVRGEDEGCSELADSNSGGHLQRIAKEYTAKRGKHAFHGSSQCGSKAMADAQHRRFEEQRITTTFKTPSSDYRDFRGWPARPGERQHEWEADRTIEPGMGCTIDGYNFREDLLRMFGNGVVYQTAELAFRDLLGKFFTS